MTEAGYIPMSTQSFPTECLCCELVFIQDLVVMELSEYHSSLNKIDVRKLVCINGGFVRFIG